MEIALKKINRWISIDLNGRMDSFNYELVTSQVSTLVKMGKKYIAIDLNDVFFLSLPSIKFFSNVASILSKKGGSFAVIAGSSELLDNIKLFNIKNQISIVQSESDLQKILEESKGNPSCE